MNQLNNHFFSQTDWLERKREECLRDLQALKALLDKVSGLGYEDRLRTFNTVLRQASGAYQTLVRIDSLRNWCDPDSAGKTTGADSLRQDLKTLFGVDIGDYAEERRAA